MYYVLSAPALPEARLREFAAKKEARRAVFGGIVGPQRFCVACQNALQGKLVSATEIITHAYTDGGVFAAHARQLAEIGGTAVPTVVASDVFSAEEMHAHLLQVLARTPYPALTGHANTQQLIQALRSTTAPVHLVVLSGIGRTFAQAGKQILVALQTPALCASLLRAVGVFVRGLYLVLKAGHMHGAIDAHSLRITEHMRVCLHDWNAREACDDLGMNTVRAWYTSLQHEPHQHPLVWMLTLCWFKWLQVQHHTDPAEFFVQLSLKASLVHLAHDIKGEPAPSDVPERMWARALVGMFPEQSTAHPPGVAWVVGVLRDVCAADETKTYLVLDRMWTNAKRVFVKTFAESHKSYRKQLQAAVKRRQAEFPQSFSLRCIHARACEEDMPAEHTERMLACFFAGAANLPIEVRGDREFVCRELCRWTDLLNAVRELWAVLSASHGGTPKPVLLALREVMNSSLQNMDTAIQQLSDALDAVPSSASSARNAPQAGISWSTDAL